MSHSKLLEVRRSIGRMKRNFSRKPEGWGRDFGAEIKARLPHLEVGVIFDVGAHIGMTAIEFTDLFPQATLHAFEPHPANFARMQANLTGKPDVKRYLLGLGDQPGELAFELDPEHPSMARISDQGTEKVVVSTVDGFCAEHGVDRIDLMKVDTEGFELPVLKGASGMLERGAIKLIKLECAIDPDSDYHTQLFDICNVLHPYGYRLFGIYDQWEDVFTDSPRIRRFDAAFVAKDLQTRGG